MITVLLAAWQGAAYIEEQLDSILRQKGIGSASKESEVSESREPGIRIFISDDGSTDGTGEILEQYKERYPEQIRLVHRSPERKEKDQADGIPPAAGNFFWLLSECCKALEDEEKCKNQNGGQYVMLSDQDDVWKEQKAAKLLAEMKRLEKQYGEDHPILVHSDMEVADANLKTIHPSFFKYQKCSPSRTSFSEILVENSVTGGAVMMNRALLMLFKERPAACFMHDWWIALAASCFGTIAWVKESLYLYRQHGNNTLGAKKSGNLKAIAERIGQIFGKKAMKNDGSQEVGNIAGGSAQVEENYRKMAAQAHAFGKLYGEQMSEGQKATLRAYLALRYQSPLGRLKNVLKNRFFKNSWIQTLAQCVTIPRPDGENRPV